MTAPVAKCPACKQVLLQALNGQWFCVSVFEQCPLKGHLMDAEVWSRLLLAPDGMVDPVVVPRATIADIRGLATWHHDPEADPADESPADQTAHVNGLIVQLCDAVAPPEPQP